MADIHAFITAVRNSRVLSDGQKKDLLDQPEALPEGYRKRVEDMLEAFDAHSEIREKALRDDLAKALNAFEEEVAASDLTDDEKRKVLAKAKKQNAEFFPQHDRV